MNDMPSPSVIGFVGTGTMGYPMAVRLLSKGHELVVWNRTPDKAEGLKKHGATIVYDVKDVNADAVITMLTDGPTTIDVLLHQGLAASMTPGSTIIDMASAAPQDARALDRLLDDVGVGYLDAPVSGGPAGAKEGSLAIMVGGNQVDFDRNAALLKSLGHPTFVGPTGSGMTMKLLNQLIIANTLAAVSEAILLGKAADLNIASMPEALSAGSATSPILSRFGPRIIARDYESSGTITLFLKDLRNVRKLALELGLNLPLFDTVINMYERLENEGKGYLGHTAVFTEFETLNSEVRGLGPLPL